MKIINAVWEKRNMDIDTIEIEVEKQDSAEDVKKIISEITSEYVVVKIPSTKSDITFLANQYGYSYIEDMIHLTNPLHPVYRSAVQQRLYDAILIQQMTKQDIDVLFQEIRLGMFSTDRISNDPFFSAKQAAERYIGWISDELNRNTEFYKYLYHDNAIGFFTLKELKKGIFESVLGGFYNKYRQNGFGSVYKVPDLVKKRGGKKLLTSVSSNNIAQVKVLLSNGYIPEQINHVFIKHIQ